MMASDHAGDPRDVVEEKKKLALECLHEAWHDAETEGIESDILAHAALFAGISYLVRRYGETTVSDMMRGVPDRIMLGDYTLVRAVQ